MQRATLREFRDRERRFARPHSFVATRSAGARGRVTHSSKTRRRSRPPKELESLPLPLPGDGRHADGQRIPVRCAAPTRAHPARSRRLPEVTPRERGRCRPTPERRGGAPAKGRGRRGRVPTGAGGSGAIVVPTALFSSASGARAAQPLGRGMAFESTFPAGLLAWGREPGCRANLAAHPQGSKEAGCAVGARAQSASTTRTASLPPKPSSPRGTPEGTVHCPSRRKPKR